MVKSLYSSRGQEFGSQPPLTTAPRDPTSSSGFPWHLHPLAQTPATPTHIHFNFFKQLKVGRQTRLKRIQKPPI